MVGMILNTLIKNKSYYVNLSNLSFIKSKILNKRIGLGIFKWIVKNTVFKYLNQVICRSDGTEMRSFDTQAYAKE